MFSKRMSSLSTTRPVTGTSTTARRPRGARTHWLAWRSSDANRQRFAGRKHDVFGGLHGLLVCGRNHAGRDEG